MTTLILALRASLFYLGYVISIIWFSITGLLLFSFLPYNIRCKYILLWNRFTIIWLNICCGVSYKVIGAEHIPDGPFVALSKHQSQWETYFLQYYLFPVCFVLKKELLNMPFFGWALRLTKPIAINRGNPKQALKQTLEEGQLRLAEQISVLIFPEGTRIDPGLPSKYARGGANIAVAAGVPVLPIALNAGHYWPADRFIKRPGTVIVKIGEPIATDTLSSREITEQVQQWIEHEVAQMPTL